MKRFAILFAMLVVFAWANCAPACDNAGFGFAADGCGVAAAPYGFAAVPQYRFQAAIPHDVFGGGYGFGVNRFGFVGHRRFGARVVVRQPQVVIRNRGVFGRRSTVIVNP